MTINFFSIIFFLLIAALGTGCATTAQPKEDLSAAGSCDPKHGHAVGSKLGVLSLPLHKMDGKTVCAMPGDTNIIKWLDGTPPTRKVEGSCPHICPTGLVPVFKPDGTPACRPQGVTPRSGEKGCTAPNT